jgi:hypothetical protein
MSPPWQNKNIYEQQPPWHGSQIYCTATLKC